MDAIAHDPECLKMSLRAHYRDERGACYCDLINHVVERERIKARRYLLSDDENSNAQAYRQAVADAAAAIKAMVRPDCLLDEYDAIEALAAVEGLLP